MQIGVDASGDFAMGDGFEPTVTAAAVGSTAAFAEISDWTAEALERWGLDHKLSELHAKELFADKVPRGLRDAQPARRSSARCGRDRLAAARVPSSCFWSPRASAKGRHEHAGNYRRRSSPSRRGDRVARRSKVQERGAAYAFGATLPVLVVLALQQSFCYFRGNTYRDEMATIDLLIDEEPARTVGYERNTAGHDWRRRAV